MRSNEYKLEALFTGTLKVKGAFLTDSVMKTRSVVGEMVALFLALNLSIRSGFAQETATRSLKRFLRDYAADALGPGIKANYIAVSASLSGSKTKEMIVRLDHPAFCGTGGCDTLVLQPRGAKYRVITSITPGWPPYAC